MTQGQTQVRVLVTGATGFIGRHLVAALVDQGTEVVAPVRRERLPPRPTHESVTYVPCSDWSEAGLYGALASQPFDLAFHLTAYGVRPTDRDPESMLRINVELPSAVLHLCHRVGAGLVMAGSFSEYRRPIDDMPLTEDSPLETSKLYGASKAAGGIFVSAHARHLGVALRLLRFFQVYGEGEAEYRLLPSLVTGLAAGKRVALSAGTQVRDFLYVKDAVAACIRAGNDIGLSSRPSTATWNVSTGVGHSVRDFAELAAKIVGASPDLLGFGDLPMRADDENCLVGNSERIRRELGWAPAYDLAAGAAAAIAALTTRLDAEAHSALQQSP